MYSFLNSNFYAVKWYHDMHLFNDRCSNKLVNIVLEGGKRILSKPIKKKEPITADIIHKLFNFYKNNLAFIQQSFTCFDKILLPPSNTIFTNLLLQRSLNKCMS
jgi:hypothetical protein